MIKYEPYSNAAMSAIHALIYLFVLIVALPAIAGVTKNRDQETAERLLDWTDQSFHVESPGSAGHRQTSIDGKQVVSFWWDDKREVGRDTRKTRVAVTWNYGTDEGILAIRDIAVSKIFDLEVAFTLSDLSLFYYVDGNPTPFDKNTRDWVDIILNDLNRTIDEFGGSYGDLFERVLGTS